MHWLDAPDFDLEATLASGQTFCWEPISPGRWQGFIGSTPVRLTPCPGGLAVEGTVNPQTLRDYFHLNDSWAAWLQALPPDPVLQAARAACPGLRLIRDEWWPCTASFICSSLKPVPLIRRIHWNLRRAFAPQGAQFPDLPFPTPQQIAAATETDLRALGLGYRARHLHAAARLLAEGRFDFAHLQDIPTAEAARRLQTLPGVGDKVAHCILLYAGGRLDAFPLDVWMIRILSQHYRRPGRRLRRIADLHRFAARQLGPLRGIAQLFLFHAARQGGRPQASGNH